MHQVKAASQELLLHQEHLILPTKMLAWILGATIMAQMMAYGVLQKSYISIDSLLATKSPQKGAQKLGPQ